MREFKLPKEYLLGNLTKMIEQKLGKGKGNYLVTEQDIASKYNVEVMKLFLKEAIPFE